MAARHTPWPSSEAGGATVVLVVAVVVAVVGLSLGVHALDTTSAKGPSSSTPSPPTPSELLPGHTLLPGRSLYSANGRFRLQMETTGDLVLTSVSSPGSPLWTSNTARNNDAYLVMQPDGNLVVYPVNGPFPVGAATDALWSTQTNGSSGTSAELTNAGTFEIVLGASVLWRS